MAGQLIVSISGIRDRTLGDVADFCAELDARQIPASLLVAPRLKGGYRLDRDATTVDWLTARRTGGAAVVLQHPDSGQHHHHREADEEHRLRQMAADGAADECRRDAGGREDGGQPPLHVPGPYLRQRADRRGDADDQQRQRNRLLDPQAQDIDQRRYRQNGTAAAEQAEQDADDGAQAKGENDIHG